MANDPELRKTVTQLLAARSDSALNSDPTTTSASERDLTELHARLGKELEPGISAHDFVGFVVADKQLRIVADSAPELIGQSLPQLRRLSNADA